MTVYPDLPESVLPQEDMAFVMVPFSGIGIDICICSDPVRAEFQPVELLGLVKYPICNIVRTYSFLTSPLSTLVLPL